MLFCIFVKYSKEIFRFLANQHQIWQGALFQNGGIHKGANITAPHFYFSRSAKKKWNALHQQYYIGGEHLGSYPVTYGIWHTPYMSYTSNGVLKVRGLSVHIKHLVFTIN